MVDGAIEGKDDATKNGRTVGYADGNRVVGEALGFSDDGIDGSDGDDDG